jgi:hypothetical protein
MKNGLNRKERTATGIRLKNIIMAMIMIGNNVITLVTLPITGAIKVSSEIF